MADNVHAGSSDNASSERKAPRRIGKETSATRGLILEATRHVLIEEGYAAVTTRRVASRAALKPALVQYYFPTTEELLVATYRDAAEQSLHRHLEAARSGDPLRALWTLSTDTSRTALALEFLALSNHRKSIKVEIARYAEQIRAIQVEALTRQLGDPVAGLAPCTPAAMSFLIAAVSRAMVMEEGVHLSAGHADTRALVDWLLRRIEAEAKSGGDVQISRA